MGAWPGVGSGAGTDGRSLVSGTWRVGGAWWAGPGGWEEPGGAGMGRWAGPARWEEPGLAAGPSICSSACLTPWALAEDPAYTPRECFQRISRRLRAVLKRSRIPMVSTRLGPSPRLPASASQLGRREGRPVSHRTRAVTETGPGTHQWDLTAGPRAGQGLFLTVGAAGCVGEHQAPGAGTRGDSGTSVPGAPGTG